MLNKLTKEQAVVISAYTEILACPFEDFHEYIEKILGFPVLTHQIPEFRDKIKELSREDFLSICYGK